jgi:hypothetical protein
MADTDLVAEMLRNPTYDPLAASENRNSIEV